ncbi:conserved oligomeric Golgi complex subunit 4 [Dermatophagoides pteronyssinus]|uniref:conserved oligomeric Golgi complex subunit 4 n=1 Tax=Dermatophagoides pteronyssinus TaxID=6956 RepID=UPI003F66D99A
MDEFRHIQSRSDILSTLEHLNEEEKIVEQDIDLFLKKENELQLLMTSLIKHMANISLIESDAERLANLMNFTSVMADNVSYKIRSFDLVKNRVSECLKQVEDIIDLRSCTDGIQKSLADEDYEKAARHIYRFLSMDESMLRKTALDESLSGNNEIPDTCSLEQSFVKLHEAEQNLRSIVMTRFDKAVAHKDSASVERFFKIFPLIKQHKQGLDRFSDYLWSQIIEEITNKKINAATKGSVTLAKLSNLFETIAQKIDVYYPLIETYYGPGNLFPVVAKLQKECDIQAKLIIEDYQNEKTFTSLVSNVSRALKNFSNTQNISKLDPKVVDKHLNDIMYMLNRNQTYLNFISNRLISDIEAAKNNEKVDQLHDKLPIRFQCQDIDSLIRDCNLSHVIHDLDSIYVLLEEYFLKESIQKAIQLDSVDIDHKDLDSTAITSSMLDDIFFIIKKCLKRAISCGSANVIMAMINHCTIVLETIFYEVIHSRIKCGYPNALSTLDLANAYNALQAGRYLQSSNDVEQMKIMFICALNNLDTACEYMNKLNQTITVDVTNSGVLQKNQIDLFDSCLSNFSSLTSKFRILIQSGMQQLFAAVFKTIVKSMIDSFISTSHTLNDEDIITYEISEGLRPFIQTFLMSMNSTLAPFKKQLTAKNFDTLLTVISAEISNRLYKALFQCSFNKFGGFQLDREVRAIINFLTSISPTTISLREYFSKLKFIGVIFTSENINEINDYIHSKENYNALRVNPNELHQLLRLYTELSPNDLRKIKL